MRVRAAKATTGMQRLRPRVDRSFDADLLSFLDEGMKQGRARVVRVGFGQRDISLDLQLCRITAHTAIEWIDDDNKRRFIAADEGKRSAKNGALVRIVDRPATGARWLIEGFQVDIEGSGTLHFARIAGNMSFEIETAEFGPAVY